MASRMERYYKSEERSKKNEHLYKQISELDTYTNIAGVADIESDNEININTVRQMVKSREELNKTRNYDDLFVAPKEELPAPPVDTEEKNYDIRDILNKAKIDHSDNDIKYRNLKSSQYDILRSLKIEEPADEDLKSLFTSMSINKNADDFGMFDNLKSDTMVGDPASIRKVLDEAKKSEDDAPTVEQVTTGNLDNIDRTFYTSSFSFSDKDFEDLRSLDSSIKRNNKLIKVLICIFSVLIAIAIIYVLVRVIF